LSVGDRLEIFILLSEFFYHKRHGTPLAVHYIYWGRFEVQSTKQQGISHFLTRTNFSFQKKTIPQVDMKQVAALQIYNKLQKAYMLNMLTVDSSRRN